MIWGSSRNSNPLQYPCLENLMDREAWWVGHDWATNTHTHSRLIFFFFFLLLRILVLGQGSNPRPTVEVWSQPLDLQGSSSRLNFTSKHSETSDLPVRYELDFIESCSVKLIEELTVITILQHQLGRGTKPLFSLGSLLPGSRAICQGKSLEIQFQMAILLRSIFIRTTTS